MILGIVGPTGSGKSALSVKVAKAIDGEVISCDSVQIYRGFNIGSGKISSAEMEGIKHHLLDIKEGNESFTVGEFIELAEVLVNDIIDRGKIPIITGGTGLYYKAFAYRYQLQDNNSKKEDKVRAEFYSLLEDRGVDYLYKLLKSVDEESWKIIDARHSSRIIRALVYYFTYGESIVKQNISCLGLRDDLIGIFLDVKRDLLYSRINRRVDEMLADGLVEEVSALLANGISFDSPPMKTIGYKEVVAYLRGLISYNEMVDKIKQASRNYAKRQITWFRGQKELNCFDYNCLEDQGKIIDFIKGKFKK